MKMHGSVPRPTSRVSKEELYERRLARAERKRQMERDQLAAANERIAELEEQLAGNDIAAIDVQHSVQDGDTARGV